MSSSEKRTISEQSGLPTTEQAVKLATVAEERLEQMQKVSPVSPTGKQVIEKSRHLIDSFKQTLLTKNSNNQLQKILADIRLAEIPEPVDTEQSRAAWATQWQELAQDVRTILSQMTDITWAFMTSSEFRSMLQEMLEVFGEFLNLLSMKTGEVAEKVGSTEGQAAGVKEVARESKEEIKAAADEFQQRFAKRSDRVFDRLKSTFDRLSEQKEWLRFVSNLNDMFNHFFWIAEKTEEAAVREHELLWQDEHVRDAVYNIKQLLENFANGHSLDTLISSASKLLEVIARDDNLKSLWTDFQNVSKRMFQEPSFVKSNEFEHDAHKLVEKTRLLETDELMSQLQVISKEGRSLIGAISSDQQLKQLTWDASQLVATMFLDRNGNLAFKPELLNDSALMLRFVAESLKHLTIDRVEQCEEDFEFIGENIVVNAEGAVPATARLRLTSNIDFEKNERPRNLLEMKFSRINMAVDNMRFWFQKKSFPQIEDYGSASLTFGDDGMTVWINLAFEAEERAKKLFDITKVDVSIPDFDMDMKASQHSIMYSVLGPLIRQRLRSTMESKIAENIRSFLLQFEQQLLSLMEQGQVTR